MTRIEGFGIIRLLTEPLHDYLAALNVCLGRFKIKHLAAIILSFGVSWWCYVPIHELSHALGCIIGGGQVSKLEIAAIYGADFLKSVFPFVESGSQYAGRLSGFDTHGSDLTYLLTDFFPYILTIVFGVPLLKSVSSRNATPLTNSIIFGISLPFAYAPFISVTGDFYEMGSILVSRVAALLVPSVSPERWRSDDLFRLTEQLFFFNNVQWVPDSIIVVSSFLLGVVLIFAVYLSGSVWTGFIVRMKKKIKANCSV
jgi:hypothetical protein